MGKYWTHPLIIIVLTIIAGVLFFSMKKSTNRYQSTSNTIEVLEKNNQKNAVKLEELKQELEFSNSNFAKEKIIRDELLMQKPGEYVLQIPASLPEPAAAPPSPTPTPWEAWMKILF